VTVFHFELRAGIHIAHAFNLSQAELDRTLLEDWRRRDEIDFGDRRWNPDRTQLKIYEGRLLQGPELSFGRGWTNAVKRGDDVTADQLARLGPVAGTGGPGAGTGSGTRGGAGTAAGPGAVISAGLDALRREILAQCRAAPIGVHQVLGLTNRWYPERRVSDRLALAEAAIWGLLHESLVGLRQVAPGKPDQPVDPVDWEGILLDWRTWADPETPAVLIEALPTPTTDHARPGRGLGTH
jgi:hypothetical protein